MAKRNVNVVLRQDMEALGVSGDVVKVRPGFARNFLIPRSLAVVASRDNLKQIEHEKSLALQRLERRRQQAAEMAKVFDGLELHVAKQVSDPMEGRLFGSVTLADVMEAFKVKGFDVEKRNVLLPDEAIKLTGEYEVRVKLGAGVEVPIKLQVKTAA